jgi:hypothetical protein
VHAEARRQAWFASCGQKPDQIEAREERAKGKLVAIVTESRVNLTVPEKLKTGGIKALFVKINTATEVVGELAGDTAVRSRVLVVVFTRPQNGITGLPVRKNKFLKDGFTHFTITSVPKAVRERQGALSEGHYDESGWKITFYKPTSGHRHADEKGGEVVQEFQSELFVLQYLFENGLTALYGVPLIASWNFLPKRDDMREEENAATAAIQIMFGRPGRLHPEGSYHRVRLMRHFRDLYRESASDEDELEQKVAEAFAQTALGENIAQRFEEGTFERRTYYLALDNSVAYATHNTVDGQLVVKIDLRARAVKVGLVKRGINGNALMELYDDFLVSQNFRQVSWQEFTAHTAGIGLADLGCQAS